MLNAESMVFKNPIWLKIVLYFGVVFFPLSTIGISYLAYEEFKNDNQFLSIFFLFGALFFLYLTILGFKLLKYISAEIALSESGIKVLIGSNINHYTWNQVGRIKNSVRFQLYALYDRSDQPIFIVDYMIPGFDELKKYSEKRVHI